MPKAAKANQHFVASHNEAARASDAPESMKVGIRFVDWPGCLSDWSQFGCEYLSEQ
jgi:hypothetical protein